MHKIRRHRGTQKFWLGIGLIAVGIVVVLCVLPWWVWIVAAGLALVAVGVLFVLS